MSDREVSIKITGKNLSDPAFDAARKSLAALGAEATKAKSWGDLLTAGMSHAGNQATASSKMIQGMSAVGRVELERLAKAAEPVPERFSMAASAASLLKSTFAQFTLANLVSDGLLRIVGSLQEFIAIGMKLPAVAASFDRLSVGVKQNANEMLQAMRIATLGLVSDYDLMLSANKAMLLGLPVTSKTMGELARSATVLGRAMGQDATKSLDDLITALGRSSPLILDNLGLTVKVSEANEAYASKLGQTSDQLSEAEKKLAFYEAATEAARRKVAELGDHTKTLGEISGTAWTKVGNLVSMAAAEINTGIGAAVGSGSRFLLFLRESMSSGVLVAAHLAKMRAEFDGIGERTEDIALAAEAGQRQWKSYAVQLAEAQASAAGLTEAQRAELLAAKQLGVGVDELKTKFGLNEAALGMVTAQHKTATKEVDKHAEANKRLAESYRQIAEEAVVDINYAEWARAREQAELLTSELTILSGLSFKQPAADLGLVQLELQQLEQRVLGLNLGPAFMVALTPPPSVWASIRDSFGKNLGDAILGAIQGGGDIMKTIGGLFGQSLTKQLFGGDGMQKSITDIFGKTIGGALNAILPGVGALVGPLVSKIGNAFKNLFGGGEHSKVNDLRDQFIVAAGGLHELNVKAVAAGTNLDALLRAKKVEDFEKAVADLNAKMGVFADEQAADASRLDAAIQKYGFSFEQLGPKFQAQQLHEMATELIEDWRVLVDSGIEVDVVNGQMAESINAYLQKAIQTGQEVPAAMQPILQKMIEQGQLTDANGNKITDLGEAGITFAQTMTQGFDRIVVKLQELIDRVQAAGTDIADLPQDARTAADGISAQLAGIRVPNITIPYYYRAQNSLPGGTDTGGADVMHSGGIVRAHAGMFVGQRLAPDEVPIIAQTGEGILSRRGMAALGGPSALNALNGGRSTQTVTNTMTIVVIGEDGSARQGTWADTPERARRWLQDLIDGGGLRIPQRVIAARAR